MTTIKKLEYKAKKALKEAYTKLNHYHLQVELEGKQVSPNLQILHELLAQLTLGLVPEFLSDRKYLCKLYPVAVPDFIYEKLIEHSLGDPTLGITCFWVTYCQFHKYLHKYHQLDSALLGIQEHITSEYIQRVLSLEELP